MKKYIKPNTEVIDVKLQQMIAASTLGFGDPVSNGNVAEGREFDFDFDFDDNDFDFEDETISLDI